MEEMKKNELDEQQKKDVEAFVQLPEWVKQRLLDKGEGMVQGAMLMKKLAG